MFGQRLPQFRGEEIDLTLEPLTQHIIIAGRVACSPQLAQFLSQPGDVTSGQEIAADGQNCFRAAAGDANDMQGLRIARIHLQCDERIEQGIQPLSHRQ